MQKKAILLALILLFVLRSGFAQENQTQVTINKKVEVVDYAYQYVIVEFISSLYYSGYYPLPTFANISDKQHYFEQGRNIRLGSQFGFSQTLKTGRWAITSGISVLNYSELFAYHDYSINNVVIENADGSLQSITIAEGEPVPYSNNNTLVYLQIPFCLGYYPKTFHEKMAINLAVNYNYLVNANYMAKYTTIQPAVDVSYSEFNRSYASVTGSLIFSAIRHKNLSLNIEPYFCWGLSKIIDQPDLSFGMNAVGVKAYLSLFY